RHHRRAARARRARGAGQDRKPLSAPPDPVPTTFFGKVKALRKRYHKQEHVLFFIGGFLFDLWLLEGIDSRPMLIHQGSYLILLTVLMAVDHHYTVKGPPQRKLFAKA